MVFDDKQNVVGTSLTAQVLKVASENPELRAKLIPLVKEHMASFRMNSPLLKTAGHDYDKNMTDWVELLVKKSQKALRDLKQNKGEPKGSMNDLMGLMNDYDSTEWHEQYYR